MQASPEAIQTALQNFNDRLSEQSNQSIAVDSEGFKELVQCPEPTMPSRATLTKTRGKDEGWAKSQASHSINANVNSDSWLLVQLLMTFDFTATCNFHQCRHADAVRRAPFSSAGPATKRSDEMCPATGDKCAPYSEHLRPAHVKQHWRSLSQLSIRIKGVSPVIHVICVLFLFLINQLVISWVLGCWKHNNQITKTDTPTHCPQIDQNVGTYVLTAISNS